MQSTNVNKVLSEGLIVACHQQEPDGHPIEESTEATTGIEDDGIVLSHSGEVLDEEEREVVVGSDRVLVVLNVVAVVEGDRVVGGVDHGAGLVGVDEGVLVIQEGVLSPVAAGHTDAECDDGSDIEESTGEGAEVVQGGTDGEPAEFSHDEALGDDGVADAQVVPELAVNDEEAGQVASKVPLGVAAVGHGSGQVLIPIVGGVVHGNVVSAVSFGSFAHHRPDDPNEEPLQGTTGGVGGLEDGAVDDAVKGKDVGDELIEPHGKIENGEGAVDDGVVLEVSGDEEVDPEGQVEGDPEEEPVHEDAIDLGLVDEFGPDVGAEEGLEELWNGTDTGLVSEAAEVGEADTLIDDGVEVLDRLLGIL